MSERGRHTTCGDESGDHHQADGHRVTGIDQRATDRCPGTDRKVHSHRKVRSRCSAPWHGGRSRRSPVKGILCTAGVIPKALRPQPNTPMSPTINGNAVTE